MKKILAIALALVMMLAVCVPAFAADVTITDESDPKTGDTLLYTRTTDEDGQEASGFTVTIPATVEIPWGGTSTGDYLEMTYESQLQIGKQLSISLDKTGGNLTNGSDNLPYTLTGACVGTALLTGAEVLSGTESIGINVTGWDDVPVDEYADTVTFTVAVVDIV